VPIVGDRDEVVRSREKPICGMPALDSNAPPTPNCTGGRSTAWWARSFAWTVSTAIVLIGVSDAQIPVASFWPVA
jgi:hypothetical protein